MKTVKVNIIKDKSGEYSINYEVDGYAGLGCEEVAQALSSLGDTTERKLTDSAYQQEIPVPLPVSQM